MRAGDFDCQVTIERRVTTQDATYGTPVVTWTPFITRAWAEVQDELPSRSESVRTGVAQAVFRPILRMRYRNDIDSTMRVWVYRDAAVLYQIVSEPAMVGRKQRIEMQLERWSTTGTPP